MRVLPCCRFLLHYFMFRTHYISTLYRLISSGSLFVLTSSFISVASFSSSPRLADMGAATTDDQTGATTASSSVAGEGSDKVYAVDRKFIVEVRKQIRDEDSGAESDSGDSDSDGDDSEGVAAKYCGSAQLSLDCIECKIGNMTYRFDKSKGFVECS